MTGAPLRYAWSANGESHELEMLPVLGTHGAPYLFGRPLQQAPIEVAGFHIGATAVTRALWTHVMHADRWNGEDPRRPADHVSWNDVTTPGGFLDRLNASEILAAMANGNALLRFRLPSETEWEYAARGGPHWKDGFTYSGSNDIDAVAWYGSKWTGGQLKWDVVKWWMWFGRRFLGRRGKETHPHDVALKVPNQLGAYDMSGNVWEWCQDICSDDLALVPRDGSAYAGEGSERRLRGGSHQNWSIHCTVSWRYGIVPEANDGCIGLRLALGPAVGIVP